MSPGTQHSKVVPLLWLLLLLFCCSSNLSVCTLFNTSSQVGLHAYGSMASISVCGASRHLGCPCCWQEQPGMPDHPHPCKRLFNVIIACILACPACLWARGGYKGQLAAREGAGVTAAAGTSAPTWGQYQAVGLAYVTARHLNQRICVNLDELLGPFCCSCVCCCCSKAA